MKLCFISDCRQQHSPHGRAKHAIDLFVDERFISVREAITAGVQVRVVVVSARYGLIGAEAVVRPYGNGLTYERVDELYPALRRQWNQNAERWFADVDDLMLATTGPHLYVLQRMELPKVWIPRMQRTIYIHNSLQLEDWLTSELDHELAGA